MRAEAVADVEARADREAVWGALVDDGCLQIDGGYAKGPHDGPGLARPGGQKRRSVFGHPDVLPISKKLKMKRVGGVRLGSGVGGLGAGRVPMCV